MIARIAVLLLLLLAGCSSPPAQPSAQAPDEAEPATAAGADANAPASAEEAEEPVPGGRPELVSGWRQEPWWELRQWTASHDGKTRLAVVIYKVGELWGDTSFPRPFDRPWLNPRPPDAWLAAGCPRCAGSVGGGGSSGGVLSFEDEPAEDAPARQADVVAALREAAGQGPPGVEWEVDPDWVWVTHTLPAHERLMTWLRPRLCPHR